MRFVAPVCRNIGTAFFCLSVAWLLVGHVGSAHALTDINVCSKPQLVTAINAARPGDQIRLCNGVWADLKLMVSRSGTAEQPIVLTTQSPGGVTISGRSYIELAGSYIHVSGLRWADYGDPNPKIAYVTTTPGTRGCKISEMVFNKDALAPRDTWLFQVALDGTNHEVFNIAFLDKYGLGAQFLVHEGGANRKHDIHHLYFKRTPLGYDRNGEQLNGGESLQLGAGDGVELDADDLTAHHLFFDNASGESEIISLKGSRQVLHDIVMIGCTGALSLRTGNNNTIQRVYINGQNKHLAAGFMVLGDNHVIEDVFVTGLPDQWVGGLQFTSGDANLNQDAADNVVVRSATVMDATDAITIGTVPNPPPSGLVFNNVVVVQKNSTDRVLFVTNAGKSFTFSNSFLYGQSNVGIPPGVQTVNPRLMPAQDGLYLPDPNGPAYGYGARMASLPIQKSLTGPQTFAYNVAPVSTSKISTSRRRR